MSIDPGPGSHPDVVAAESARPRGYVCLRAPGPIRVDGRGADPAWSGTPWTEDFVDIEGDLRPRPPRRTRARMLHDDRFLYVHAELEEPHVRATIGRRNAVIFHDNDFELFVDPDGDHHDYYELEINALGTTWELTLPRPYRAGGTPRDPDSLDGLVAAVHVDGALNDPSTRDRGWSVELALPFVELARVTRLDTAAPPRDGERWRVNFSRVQWPHEVIGGRYRTPDAAVEDNWVWSPQGVVDMHRPATWGLVQFSSRLPAAAGGRPAMPDPDPTQPARNLLMSIWERQRLRPAPTDDLAALGLRRPPWPVSLSVTGGGRWKARLCLAADSSGPRLVMTVDETALVLLEPR